MKIVYASDVERDIASVDSCMPISIGDYLSLLDSPLWCVVAIYWRVDDCICFEKVAVVEQIRQNNKGVFAIPRKRKK